MDDPLEVPRQTPFDPLRKLSTTEWQARDEGAVAASDARRDEPEWDEPEWDAPELRPIYEAWLANILALGAEYDPRFDTIPGFNSAAELRLTPAAGLRLELPAGSMADSATGSPAGPAFPLASRPEPGPAPLDLVSFLPTSIGVAATATAVAVIGTAIGAAEVAAREANRAMAAHLEALTTVIEMARQNPSIYLTESGLLQPDAVDLAVRCAALDTALHLHLTPELVRTRAHEGHVLTASLPQVWALFQAGLIGYPQASAAVHFLTGLTDPARVATYDTELALKGPRLTPGVFRQKARTLADRLRAEPAEQRHARDVTERRVSVEPAPNGMAWLSAFISGVDAIRITARLNATAKRIARDETAARTQAVATARAAARRSVRRAGLTGPETHEFVARAGQDAAARHPRRSRDQIRADLFVAWLAGDGTPTAAKVRPLLLVPILGLLQKSDQPAVLHGYGPIDSVTAAQLFDDAPAFRRVGIDPINGTILNFDRTRYRPTKAQRDMLAAIYGTCAAEGCTRLAVTAEIDHVHEWERDHGPTNLANLLPFCSPDHRIKTHSKIRYAKAADGTVTVSTPTGYIGHSQPEPPLPDKPPF
ncbi:HNH endonuclease signature motif containing protein [Glaciibacter psychrotolerans]|uniref:DUF222 domain-containing protein n=1 Tax=Glaciibacter psychrotolerans TaxID=670054 RepID=A0A7Z0EC37_9MICO|nr:HNH endonuclease signature motif containing protein [Leifsonia psychrotolerans]NYJ18855.1 hypothetical protein [Leifsonia psychrotolerans]